MRRNSALFSLVPLVLLCLLFLGACSREKASGGTPSSGEDAGLEEIVVHEESGPVRLSRGADFQKGASGTGTESLSVPPMTAASGISTLPSAAASGISAPPTAAPSGIAAPPSASVSGISAPPPDPRIGPEVTQLILVSPISGTQGEVTFLEKNGTVWTERFTTGAILGRNGLGKTKEGDGKTPVGVFRFTKAFGILPDPGCPLGYTKVGAEDYWCGDSASIWYNRYVTKAEKGQFDRKKSEHLALCAPEYNYALNISYNESGTPGKGSAIFLHCFSGRPDTSGCVAIAEERMRELLKSLRADARI
ncbi:MAG: L,D-transpeptidase family protein, partial [Lachnospiraceae bacterium]|nr:L,D-transpeptidase family protein [Lachnospiraceae bacterium]